MRAFRDLCAVKGGITASQRSDVYKSAGFILKEEHTALVKELIAELEAAEFTDDSRKLYTTGILADSPSLLSIFEDYGFRVVADDVAAESRQYRTDTPDDDSPVNALARKFQAMDNCSVLYDVKKQRVGLIVEEAKKFHADAVLVVLTKFCDPEEFDYPLIKRACEEAEIPCLLVEIDRQMTNYEQARTMIEGLADMLI